VIELVIRIGFSLLIVFGLMWALAKVARRPLAGRAGAAALSVVARTQLSRSASIAVVQVADRALIVGVTDGQVSLLGETELAALRPPAAAVERRDAILLNGAVVPGADGATEAPAGRLDGSLLSPRTWRQTVDFLRERTARR
jgi:flagellar protein FliO/FliZ